MEKDVGFNRQVGEISIIIDKNGNVVFSSVAPELIDLILSLDDNNDRFLSIKEHHDK